LQKKLVKSKKVTMVDRANFDKQMKELGLLNKDIANRENQNKLKQVAIADYILVGQIDSFSVKHTEKDIALTGEHISKTDASLQISYKLIETATMDIVSSDSTTKSVHFDYNAGCSAVANRLVEQAGADLADKMIEDVFGE
jgi:curli biogenesis system outer membrane secretion channel CsgG